MDGPWIASFTDGTRIDSQRCSAPPATTTATACPNTLARHDVVFLFFILFYFLAMMLFTDNLHNIMYDNSFVVVARIVVFVANHRLDVVLLTGAQQQVDECI